MSNARAANPYQQSIWGTLDPVSRNCLLAAAAAGLAVLVAVFLAPAVPVREVTIQEMPERFARLILEKPRPAAPVRPAAPASSYEAPREVAQAAPKPAVEVAPKQATPPPAARRRAAPEVAPDKGSQGRAKARTEVVANLQEVSGSLDKVLGELSQALPAAGTADKPARSDRRRGRRDVRQGRVATQLEAVDLVADLSTAGGQGSQLAVRSIDIAAITDVRFGGDGEAGGSGVRGAGAAGPGGAAGAEIRSNESLLAVVRRYAPGIQFCYENELKKSPGLRGKLVVSLTVAADGRVTAVVPVEDTLASPAVRACVLAQMEGWRFPAVERGEVTFKAPFVFTPPE